MNARIYVMHRTLLAAFASIVIAGCGDGNRQSMNVSGGSAGNISQNQSGMGNSQSMSIGSVSNDGGKTPSIVQSQSGVNREQTLIIDGKKVESKEK